MKIVYIAGLLTYDGLQLSGRSLLRHLSTENDVVLCGAIVPPESDLLTGRVADDVISEDALMDVDAIYMEGGWNDDRLGPDLARIRPDFADSFVRDGGQLIVSDVTRHNAASQMESLADARELLHAAVSYGRNHWGGEGIQYLYDARTATPHGYLFTTSDMTVTEWLRPALNGIDGIMTDGAVVLDGWSIAATGNSTTQALVRDEFIVGGHHWPWATAEQHGHGHVAVIGAGISADIFVDACPDNARWISNLLNLMTDRSRETIGWSRRATQQKETVAETLQSLLEQPESQSLERKSSFLVPLENDAPTEIIQHAVGKSIAALANTDGGYVMIGVADDGTLVGLNPDYAKCRGGNRDGFLQRFKDYVASQMEPSWEALGLRLNWYETAQGDVLAVQVPTSTEAVWVRSPKNKNDKKLYVRRTTVTDELHGPDILTWNEARR